MKRYHKDITISDRYQAMVQNDSSLANSFSTGKISDRERHYNKFQVPNKINLDEVSDINKGKYKIPSKYNILKNSTFGKPSLDHSFTCEACFDHVLIFILKRKYLSESILRNCLNYTLYSNI